MIENYSSVARVQDLYALLKLKNNQEDSTQKSSFAIINIAIHQIAENQHDNLQTSEINFNSLLK